MVRMPTRTVQRDGSDRQLESLVAAAFDEKAASYRQGRFRDPGFEREEARILNMLGEPAARQCSVGSPCSDPRLLEIGCGVGLTSIKLAARGWSIVATDISMEMLRIARENAVASQVSLLGLVRCDAQRLPFRQEVFGSVVCHGVLEYVPDVAESLKEQSRVTELHGNVVATVQNRLSLAGRISWLLGLMSMALHGKAGRGGLRIRAKHMMPWTLDQVAQQHGLQRRRAIVETFPFLPMDYFPRSWLALNNRIMATMPNWKALRWWGTQYIAKYKKVT